MKSRVPRGAKKLCALIASPLADERPREYRRQLAAIADSVTLDMDVRMTAALMEYRLRTRQRQGRGV